jgi:SAM-dependent methyltransferase
VAIRFEAEVPFQSVAAETRMSLDSQRCALCGEMMVLRFSDLPSRETGQVFSIYRCPECCAGFTLPQPDDLTPYYVNYQGGPSTDFCTKRRLRFLKNAIGTDLASKNLLDIGCGAGQFLLAAQQLGWKVAGVELNPETARAAGLDVFESVEAARRIGPFQCITLWHSLEHLRDPRKSILELTPLLEKGGTVIIAVPNAEGWQAHLFRSKWLHLDIPRHLSHFGPKSLKKLLEKSNLTVGRTWHQELEYDIFGWSISAFRSLTKREIGPLSDRMTLTPRSLVDAGLLMFFSLLSLPVVIAGSLAGQGGTIAMSARKN